MTNAVEHPTESIDTKRPNWVFTVTMFLTGDRTVKSRLTLDCLEQLDQHTTRALQQWAIESPRDVDALQGVGVTNALARMLYDADVKEDKIVLTASKSGRTIEVPITRTKPHLQSFEELDRLMTSGQPLRLTANGLEPISNTTKEAINMTTITTKITTGTAPAAQATRFEIRVQTLANTTFKFAVDADEKIRPTIEGQVQAMLSKGTKVKLVTITDTVEGTHYLLLPSYAGKKMTLTNQATTNTYEFTLPSAPGATTRITTGTQAPVEKKEDVTPTASPATAEQPELEAVAAVTGWDKAKAWNETARQNNITRVDRATGAAHRAVDATSAGAKKAVHATHNGLDTTIGFFKGLFGR